MKQYYSFLFFFIFIVVSAQNFTDTKGELQISASGTAVYNLPIATPPSIQNVAPVINLTYSSGVRGGIAGQGWSINSISSISRIATRIDIDGFIDGVDFDSNDKLALDGQRLLLKTGAYWANGSTYETEFKSNLKIELKIENSFLYFLVTAPDGSRTWYASRGAGTYQNAVSVNAWYIVHFEDTNGNEINYNYNNVIYNSTNQLYIKTIDFSGNSAAGIAFQNQIEFNYKSSSRIERDFINGAAFYATQILDNVMVRTNGNLFRKYQLQHQTDSSLGYQRVSSIQESNGVGELSNPVTFTYNNTEETLTRIEKEYTNTLAFDKANIAGDFDGDGRLDFVADKKIYTNLFNGNTGNSGINFPTIRPALIFTATLRPNYKMNQFQSIMEPVATNSQIQFVAYNIVDSNLNYTGLTSSTIQTIAYNNTIFIDPSYKDEDENYVPPIAPPQDTRTNEYLSGDFDGDGASEVLILSKDERYVWEEYINPSGYSEGFYWKLYSNTNSDYRREARLANLTFGGSTLLQGDSYYICATGKRYIADINGDGKSDVININQHGQYSVVEINKLPSGTTEVTRIGYGTISNYSHTKQILFGDFNGDGKTDIMLPTSEGGEGQTEWNIYYANPKPAGGDFFVKETLNIVEYRPDTGSDYNTQRHWSNYYAIDVNGDGKSDLVRVWRKYFKDDWTINNHDTQWRVTGFTNNVGKTSGSGFPLTYDSGTYTSNSPDVPIPIVSNYKYNGGNSELVIVRGHYNKIEYYQFGKDVDTDNRLKSVSESNGNIIQTIEYLPMVASNGAVGNNPADFYSAASNSPYYPFIALIKNENSYLVSRLTAKTNGVSKYQDFKYRNYISNFYYGTIGFEQTARSNWYLNSSDTKIWSVSTYGYGSRGYISSTITHNDSNNIFNFSQSNIISDKSYNYTDYSDGYVVNYRLDDEYTFDKISGINTFVNFLYDPDNYGLVETKTVESYLNNTLQGKTITNTSYDNNPNGTGANYYIGRPNQINTSTTYGGETRTSEEKLSYTNGNITRTEKKGHNTYAVVEDMTYDTVGNLLTKTISAPNAPVVPTPRTNTDVYDTSKRFVIKKTNHQGYSTDFNYNALGQVTYSKNHLNVSTTTSYDNWGKLIGTSTENTSATPVTSTIVYLKLSNGGYTVTSTNNLGEKTITEYDVLGRKVVNSVQGFAANSLLSSKTVYDALGRKKQESEPYATSATLWTTYQYDYLNRPLSITSPTGKIQSFTYSGVTTTSDDDGKITTVTVDAVGNKVQTTDEGGTVSFIYFANGSLKESNFEGHKVTSTIDGWGNKTSTTDPNAGTYSYSYDAFGQILQQTTPKGTTSYTYDNTGRLLDKKELGDYTNSTLTYTYDLATNLVTSTSFANTQEGSTTTNTFTYDNYHRLSSKTEANSYATFISSCSYDTLGRLETETKSASAGGKNSALTTRNTYQNGYHWQIIDAATAQVLWQANSFNERGQLLTASLGNGITITNSYDQYGYATQNKFDKTGSVLTNILTLTNDFDPKRGNLNSRSNSLFGWSETFSYDNLDRLISSNVTDSFLRNTFDTADTEGYVSVGGSTVGSSGGTLSVVGASQGSGVKKELLTGVRAGNQVLLNLSIVRAVGADILNVYIEEVNPSTGITTKYLKTTNTANGTINISHTVVQNGTVNLKIEKTTNSAMNVFLLDNVTGTKKYTVTQQYDNKGRITANQTGTYQYGDTTKKYQNTAVTIQDDYLAHYSNRFNQNIQYNAFKAPYEIEETGIDKIHFAYNQDNDRSSMFYGSLDTNVSLRPLRKFYSADGSMEVKHNLTTGAVEFITYIGGDGYTAPVILKSDGNTQNFLYLHRDYQGSVLAITDNGGTVVEKRLFDAWGLALKVQNGNGLAVPQGAWQLDRGYTGHEHLLSVGLINMNGRIYDPLLHRFLQPDNFVQQPDNTQNYNRYAYVLNNPLKYTDPSGESYELAIAVGIGAAIAALTYTITALVADVPFTLGGLAKATFIGAASSAVTFGIGSATAQIGNFFVRSSVQAVAHGTFQGSMTAISGGKFWSGFAAGALSSIASSAFASGYNHEGLNPDGSMMNATKVWGGAGSLSQSGAGMIAFGTVSGGAGAALTGGNFWQGAATGLVVSGLNHFAHQMKVTVQNRNINIEVTDNVTGEVTVKSQGKEYVTPTYEMNVTGIDPDGNNIAEKFDVVRFGVKDGKVQTLKAGNYTVKEYYRMFGKMPAFRVNGPYAIHMLSAGRVDANWGCLAIKGGFTEWNRFTSTLGTISGLGLFDLGSSGTMNVNVQYAKTPNVYIKN